MYRLGIDQSAVYPHRNPGHQHRITRSQSADISPSNEDKKNITPNVKHLAQSIREHPTKLTVKQKQNHKNNALQKVNTFSPQHSKEGFDRSLRHLDQINGKLRVMSHRTYENLFWTAGV